MKKLLSIAFLLCLMITTLAGCGSEKSNSTSTNTDGSTTEVAKTSEPTSSEKGGFTLSFPDKLNNTTETIYYTIPEVGVEPQMIKEIEIYNNGSHTSTLTISVPVLPAQIFDVAKAQGFSCVQFYFEANNGRTAAETHIYKGDLTMSWSGTTLTKKAEHRTEPDLNMLTTGYGGTSYFSENLKRPDNMPRDFKEEDGFTAITYTPLSERIEHIVYMLNNVEGN